MTKRFLFVTFILLSMAFGQDKKAASKLTREMNLLEARKISFEAIRFTKKVDELIPDDSPRALHIEWQYKQYLELIRRSEKLRQGEICDTFISQMEDNMKKTIVLMKELGHARCEQLRFSLEYDKLEPKKVISLKSTMPRCAQVENYIVEAYR